MQNNSTHVYRFFLALGDMLALILSFTIAYMLRVSFDTRPIAIAIDSLEFITSVIFTLPLWIVIFQVLGLYTRRIYDYRARELGRLFVASILGTMLMISFSFLTSIPLFPAKLVAVYVVLIGFCALVVIRGFIRAMRLILLDRHIGVLKLLIIGDDEATRSIASYIHTNPRSGYEIVAIVAPKRGIAAELQGRQFSSLKKALNLVKPDVIMQTDLTDSETIYDLAVDQHIEYQYIPSHHALENTRHTTDIVGTLPVIAVQTTPLVGYGRVVKRIMDICASIIILILSAPIWLCTAIIMKLSEPRAPIFYRQKRLTRHNRSIFIYKFRTMKQAYNGLSPEAAFEKMGKPELSKRYRDNGDQLDNDPRTTSIGSILRKLSIDELPQLINVMKGDISLIGPRALVPAELKQYPYKHLILSVKSGLTGLAQISGRRDISFDDRRALDIYYVHNWSLWLDIQIIIKTVYFVLIRQGAK